MSLLAYGVFELWTGDMTRREKIKVAFKVLKIAVGNDISIRFAGNVEPYVGEILRNEFGRKPNLLPFQLTGDPLTPNVEVLFSGDRVEVYAGLVSCLVNR